MTTHTLDEDLHRWLNQINDHLVKAVRLIESTPEPENLTPKAQHAYAIAVLMTDDFATREIRAQKMRERWSEWQGLSRETRRSRLHERDRRTAELKKHLSVVVDEEKRREH
jgi:hypothetical protein